MSEQAAFIKAIVQSPDDDLPRLVYADWLEENGSSDRAEFIRVQCRIEEIRRHCWCGGCRKSGQHHNGPCAIDRERVELPDGSSRNAMLRKRNIDLTRSTDPEMWSLYHQACWPPSRFAFSRGFLDTVRCETGDWIGEPCPNCHERGLADPETGIVECGRCDCTGEIGRMGPTILSDFPTVQRVELDDKEPAGDDDNGWYWFDGSQNRTGFRWPHHLEHALYRRLKGGSVNGNVTIYSTEQGAASALSDAAVMFAKEED